ncbi:hypothetical protein BDV97DRAFT_351969 [Delphinella strobiligena]|nr:hypothetical protein BDV97DRAFT_351969 [Delphinella strobiligena]
MSQEFSYADVSEHASKKDIYMIIHDKVYNTTSFVDEHPYVCPAPILRLPCPEDSTDSSPRLLKAIMFGNNDKEKNTSAD